MNTESTTSKLTNSWRSTSFGRAVHVIPSAAAWTLLIVALLLTALLSGWYLLAVLLAGGLTASQPFPVGAILAGLWAITGGLARIVAKCVASPRTVGVTLGLIPALLSIVGITWALSAPDIALFLARDMGWDGADVLQVQKFPVRAIRNAPSAFHLAQNLSPQLFQNIEYKQTGKLKRTSSLTI